MRSRSTRPRPKGNGKLRTRHPTVMVVPVIFVDWLYDCGGSVNWPAGWNPAATGAVSTGRPDSPSRRDGPTSVLDLRAKCGSREGLPVLSRRRWKPSVARMAKDGFHRASWRQDAGSERPARWHGQLAIRPAGHPWPRRASRPSGRRPRLRAAVLCAGSGVDGQPADLRNPGRGRGCPCYLDGVGNRSAARMAERGFHRASWRQDAGSERPARWHGQPRPTEGAASTGRRDGIPPLRGLRQLAGGMESRRYGGCVNWPAGSSVTA
jgi:hypothetical protein